MNDYQAPAAWQSAISQSPSIGSVFGVYCGYWGGYLIDKFGYRKSLIINYIFVIPCIGGSCILASGSEDRIPFRRSPRRFVSSTP